MAKQNETGNFPLGSSYINLIVGIIVVVAVAAVIIGLIRNKGSIQTQENEQTAQEQLEATQSGLPAKYKVAKGEDLWKISEKFYQSGYNWVDIAKANNIANPDKITEDMELTIPNVQPKVVKQASLSAQPSVQVPASTPDLSQKDKAISGNEYTVETGDDLWDIAVRAYGDGYKWVEIARANKLINPNVIHPGNVLVLPR